MIRFRRLAFTFLVLMVHADVGKSCESLTVRDAAFQEPRDLHRVVLLTHEGDEGIDAIDARLRAWFATHEKEVNLEYVKVDVDQEQQLAGYFQIRSVPTVMLVKGGQIVDGFPGALPEGQVRQFLQHHGIVALDAMAAPAVEPEVIELSLSPAEQVQAAREAVAASPQQPELRLDLIAALLQAGDATAAEHELDELPANLATDDRAKRSRAQLDFAKALLGAPGENELVVELTANPNNLRARHQLGVRRLLAGDSVDALECFLAIMRSDRKFDDDLGRKSLISAFALIDDPDLVSRTRKQMAAMIF